MRFAQNRCKLGLTIKWDRVAMASLGWDRRRIAAGMAAGLGAGVGLPLAARATPVFATDADSPLADRNYSPPTDLITLADVYRRMTAPVKINGSWCTAWPARRWPASPPPPSTSAAGTSGTR
jgi:hypothetical protein